MTARVLMLILVLTGCSDSGSLSYQSAAVGDRQERSKPDNDGIDIFTIGNGYTTNEDLDLENPDKKNFYLTLAGVEDESSVLVRSVNEYNEEVSITHIDGDSYILSQIGHQEFRVMITADHNNKGALVSLNLEQDYQETSISLNPLGSVLLSFEFAGGWKDGIQLQIRLDDAEKFAAVTVNDQKASLSHIPFGQHQLILSNENIRLVRDIFVVGDQMPVEILTDYRDDRQTPQRDAGRWEKGGNLHPDLSPVPGDSLSVSDKPYDTPDVGDQTDQEGSIESGKSVSDDEHSHDDDDSKRRNRK